MKHGSEKNYYPVLWKASIGVVHERVLIFCKNFFYVVITNYPSASQLVNDWVLQKETFYYQVIIEVLGSGILS